MTSESTETTAPGGEWKRAALLFLAVVVLSIAPAGLLVAVPLLVLIGLGGIRRLPHFMVAVVAMMFLLLGARDGMWYVYRAWALTVGGLFAALALGVPSWRLTSKLLASVGGTMVVWFGILGFRREAWATLDWTVADQLRAGYATAMQAMLVLRDGEPISPALASGLYQTIEIQTSMYPAMLALESLAALGVAWWLYVRLVHNGSDGLGPFGSFRFNDHLIWLMIAGLILMVVPGDGGVRRIGANMAAFMAGLYAFRGGAVVAFVSGGVSVLGSVLITIGFLLAAPFLLGFALFLGIADTWLDLRARVAQTAA